ncbi:iron-containing redox enzyme family protein [Nocardia sp. NBC_00881]|uniref:iron-containing redox enzyme family protein n=1 Tax=Nocardia sp. NBC_00881 TaxID=2975995 RepID=UPI00386A56B4|nr:iron-containing redox enzyme family protein [Nocardia sp. NBC_00881]
MKVTMGTRPHNLPRPRGELSDAVLEVLRGVPGGPMPRFRSVDPYGEDLHLALHTCYELHYHGFAPVDSGWEWDPGLLALRASMEQELLCALRDDVPGGTDLDGELDQLLVTPPEPSGPSRYLRDEGEWWHMREYFVHRSIFHHKEADPYAWVIPRLRGQAKASLVAVEFDEFGGGRGERVHAQLYADLMAGAGLNDEYLHYLDLVPAPMLAVVNMMSLFGLHRSLRGALVGHFATVEITSPPAAQRLVDALERLDADPACVLFYREHVEADAVHEQVMRNDVIGTLIAREPELTESMVFGIQVTNLLEDRFADHVLGCWRAGRSSLRDSD